MDSATVLAITIKTHSHLASRSAVAFLNIKEVKVHSHDRQRLRLRVHLHQDDNIVSMRMLHQTQRMGV